MAENNKQENRELVFTRIYDAPRALVFQLWTDAEHIGHWWGPNGFRTTTHRMDVRPGGVWDFIMHGPDGTDYPNHILYLEVAEPERLIYDHGEPGQPVHFRVTVTFTDRAGKTELTMRMVFPTAEERDAVVKKYGADEGAHQTLDRLGAYLPENEFVFSRPLQAPRDLVFRLWSKPEHLRHWWGPKGFTMDFIHIDFRPGGVFHYSMKAPNGSVMWGKFIYHDIVAPEKIVFVSSFSDEQGNLTRHPMAPNWPVEIMNTVTFSEQDGVTTITLRGAPIHATADERKTFRDGKPSMNQGFGGTFDQLEAYLKTL